MQKSFWVSGAAISALLLLVVIILLGSTDKSAEASLSEYDPTAYARSQLHDVRNREAVIPSQCYTKTGGDSNPCWTCHTRGRGLNHLDDWGLQEAYAFSEVGLTNYWSNMFKDRSERMRQITDSEVLDWIRTDNYTPLVKALRRQADFKGWVPDLDYQQGFDAEGFARDGSGWRAFRYKPFLGTFWPTNGNTDDVIVRLGAPFQQDADGKPSRDIYKANLAILETLMSADTTIADADVVRAIEPLDEQALGVDLDGDGRVAGVVTQIRGIPRHYVGGAAQIETQRFLYPEGTEFLHTVRYVDPDAPTLLSARMKEVRYLKKAWWKHAPWVIGMYEREHEAKERGVLPQYAGGPDEGLMNDHGWRVQGFIEDRHGRLRVQSKEETWFCMGCHTNIGVTIDQTFAFPRKLPGRGGWGHQDLRGIPDTPQATHTKPETLTYFERVRGGDELRANDEILARFFDDGSVNETEVLRASLKGDKDLAYLLTPSRERALTLNRAYMALVEEQTYTRGRDTVIKPTGRVHERIENGSTELGQAGQVFDDGRLFLDWQGFVAR